MIYAWLSCCPLMAWTAISPALVTPAKMALKSPWPPKMALGLADLLLAYDSVRWIGLGAGTPCDWRQACVSMAMIWILETSPVEAGIAWSMQITTRRWRQAGGFLGAEHYSRSAGQWAPKKARWLSGRWPRAGSRRRRDCRSSRARLLALSPVVALAPHCKAPIAMGYVPTEYAAIGYPAQALVRGKATSYYRGQNASGSPALSPRLIPN